MTTLVLVFAGIAAVFHVLFFCVESLWFINKKLYRRFGIETLEDAEKVRLMAFNQGFYNLFLALGTGLGILIVVLDDYIVGMPLILYNCAVMVGAAIVLICSKPELLRAAAVQGVPPALAILMYALS